MLSPPDRPSSCYDLYDLALQFGGEYETLPQDCQPFATPEPAEPSLPQQA